MIPARGLALLMLIVIADGIFRPALAGSNETLIDAVTGAFTPAQISELIASSAANSGARTDQETQSINRLQQLLGVSGDVVLALLRILDRPDIQPADVTQVLAQSAIQYHAVTDRLTEIAADDPDGQRIVTQAQAAMPCVTSRSRWSLREVSHARTPLRRVLTTMTGDGCRDRLFQVRAATVHGGQQHRHLGTIDVDGRLMIGQLHRNPGRVSQQIVKGLIDRHRQSPLDCEGREMRWVLGSRGAQPGFTEADRDRYRLTGLKLPIAVIEADFPWARLCPRDNRRVFLVVDEE